MQILLLGVDLLTSLLAAAALPLFKDFKKILCCAQGAHETSSAGHVHKETPHAKMSASGEERAASLAQQPRVRWMLSLFQQRDILKLVCRLGWHAAVFGGVCLHTW